MHFASMYNTLVMQAIYKCLILLVWLFPVLGHSSIGHKEDCADLLSKIFSETPDRRAFQQVLDSISVERGEPIYSSWMTTRIEGEDIYREQDEYIFGEHVSGTYRVDENFVYQLSIRNMERSIEQLRDLSSRVYGQHFATSVSDSVRLVDQSLPEGRLSYSVLKTVFRRRILGGIRVFNATKNFNVTDPTPPFIKYLKSVGISHHPLINRFHTVQDEVGDKGIFELGKFVFDETDSIPPPSYQLTVLTQAALEIMKTHPEATLFCFVLDQARMRLFRRLMGGEVWRETIGEREGFVVATSARTFLERNLSRLNQFAQELSNRETLLGNLSINNIRSLLTTPAGPDQVDRLFVSQFRSAQNNRRVDLLILLRTLGHLSPQVDRLVLNYSLSTQVEGRQYEIIKTLVREGVINAEELLNIFNHRFDQFHLEQQKRIIELLGLSPSLRARSTQDDYLSSLSIAQIGDIVYRDDMIFGEQTFNRILRSIREGQSYSEREEAYDLMTNSYLTWNRASELMRTLIESDNPIVRFFAFDLWDDCHFQGVELPAEDLFQTLQNDLIEFIRTQAPNYIEDAEYHDTLQIAVETVIEFNRGISREERQILRPWIPIYARRYGI